MGINIGNLNILLTLQQKSRFLDAGSTADSVWFTVGTIWGQVEYSGGSESFGSDQIGVAEKIKITVRYRDGITEKHRFLDGETIYDINSLPAKDKGRAYLMFDCSINK